MACEKKKSILKDVKVNNKQSEIAQLLHPCWSRRDVEDVKPFLEKIDKKLDKKPDNKVKLVLSGGGLIEIYISMDKAKLRNKKSEAMLKTLKSIVHEEMQPISALMKDLKHDYIIGVDVLIKNRNRCYRSGQFAVIYSNGVETIVWKSYPIGNEISYLAGYGTIKGRKSPRKVSTSLGYGIVLICHDSQAYNHRGEKTSKTPRKEVRLQMKSQIERKPKPKMAFNLIHWVVEEKNLITFCTSYKQIYNDNEGSPRTIGAFGYGKHVAKQLDRLANKTRPYQESGTVIILYAS